MSIRSSIANLVYNLINPGGSSPRSESLRLSVAETDLTIEKGTRYGSGFDRENVDRMTVIEQAMKARKTNPIAARICALQTEFAIGDGLGFESDQPQTKEFISKFWSHPLNDLDAQITEFADEAWTTGDLFVIGTIDPTSKMTYYRVLPAEQVAEIETKSNDYRQELAYKSGQLDDNPYKAYDPNGSEENTFVLHFPHNRVAGQCFGTSDYTTILEWLRLYSQFIRDRARLNFFRQLFTFIVQKAFKGQPEKDQYVKDFADRMPKKSGGVLAVDEDEVVGTINPNLGSFEAGEDGLLLLRMIAIGVGFPLHWLGMAESNTRTTAEASGTPAFRRLKIRQKFIVGAVRRMVTVALEIKGRADRKDIPEKPEFSITAPDLTERDNEKLALAVLRLSQALAPAYNAKKISKKEYLRLFYRFLGETRPASEPEPGDDPIIMSGSKKAEESIPKEPTE